MDLSVWDKAVKAVHESVWDRVMRAAHEFARKGDRSILQRVKDAIKKFLEISDKDKMDRAINDIMDDFNETIDDISMNDIEQNKFGYKVTDKDELDRLNKEKTFRMYSGMQEVDGKLYSPMLSLTVSVLMLLRLVLGWAQTSDQTL